MFGFETAQMPACVYGSSCGRGVAEAVDDGVGILPTRVCDPVLDHGAKRFAIIILKAIQVLQRGVGARVTRPATRSREHFLPIERLGPAHPVDIGPGSYVAGNRVL